MKRRAFAAPYESVTFSTATRSRSELTVTLASQPVFDLASSTPISQRLRRTIRRCGERSIFERKTLETDDLKQIDVLTIEHGMRLLRLASGDCGIVPAFWRTLTAARGPYALLCAASQHSSEPGSLLIEVFGGIEHTPIDVIDEALARFQTETRGVLLHIAPDIDTARRLRGVQAHCLAIDFAGVAHEGARDWLGAAELVVAARQICSQLLLVNLRPDRALAAQAAGATHAVFSTLAPRAL
ncbi:MAG: hypothetical protein U1E18_26870 [Brevundimonas sp.]|uniref:hypothetical protein n=1 Tax=Brevundimonas sp. TaxID=1871086 RepID=UPI002ABAB6D3|nr:hypothetical protein [Brevundimonas sp.]MDZ4113193.1 hypothetical protein [Brevundimonas sp.]